MTAGGSPADGVRVRLAYLCNLYPAVSHSFVRREIAGMERAGHSVVRLSIRPPPENLRDPADIAEAGITEAVLSRGALPLLGGALLSSIMRPGKAIAAAGLALRLSGPGFRNRLRHLAYWIEAGWLTRRLSALRVEHLHAHFGTNPAAVAAIAEAWGGPPFSFTVHGPDEFDAPMSLALPLKIQRAQFVAAISSYGRSQLMRWSDPEHWDKIAIARCGIDEAFLGGALELPPPNSNEFVCVARLSAQKGLPLLIAACAQLRRSGEQFSLTIIGDGELRESLELEIQRSGLADVVSMAGTRSSAEIRDKLLEARAFVLPSFAEGLPVVLMEALALGRPVITTAIAGIPELVDEDCGWLIPAGSQEALVKAMTEALRESPERLARKGSVGRERVQAMHDANANAAALAERIVAGRNGRVPDRA
jgi:colanic acid/amylovoran biosynthesis glycosyltransferase